MVPSQLRDTGRLARALRKLTGDAATPGRGDALLSVTMSGRGAAGEESGDETSRFLAEVSAAERPHVKFSAEVQNGVNNQLSSERRTRKVRTTGCRAAGQVACEGSEVTGVAGSVARTETLDYRLFRCQSWPPLSIVAGECYLLCAR